MRFFIDTANIEEIKEANVLYVELLQIHLL